MNDQTAPRVDNVEIAVLLREVADLLEIQGANPFRIRAYRNAVRTVEAETASLARRVEAGEDLTQLAGIGKEMASHIAEIVDTGTLAVRDELLDEVPGELVELMHIPNLGPKRARQLWDELGVTSVDALEAAATEGRVARLSGFGAKSQEKVLAGIAEYRRHRARFRLGDADRWIEPLLAWLGESPDVERLEVAGSYRRRRETVGDLDLLAVVPDEARREAFAERFTRYPQAESVLMAGARRASIALASGLQVDLRIVAPESYGAALVYFTGSKEHNIALRKRAVSRSLHLSEYGVFRETEGTGEPQRVTGDDERSVYGALGLAWIPPELREDRGELGAAERGELPGLIELSDLRGDLQMHSTWSDGRNSIEEMLEACAARGYEYFALTDHSQALGMARGLGPERLAEQWKEIDQITARHPEIRLLRSLEVDILADGSLDLPDEMLEQLDLVVVSVHSRFELPAAEQTRRVIKALEHPATDILAHPTGRLINRRDPFELDLDAVLQCARDNRVAVELNAHPERLDLNDIHLMRARDLGVAVVISTDAHATHHLELMRYGVEQARRAWLEPAHVLNTRPLPELLAALGKETATHSSDG